MVGKAVSIILLASIIFASSPAYSSYPPEGIRGPVEWCQYLNGPGHVGYYNGTGPSTNHTNGTFVLPDAGGAPYFPVVESPVIDSDSIYVATNPATSDTNKKLMALDKRTLKVKWEYDFDADATVAFAPVLYKDLVIGSSSKWHHVMSPTETIYGKIVALDKATGKVAWSHMEEFNNIEAVSLDGDTLYFGTVGYFYADAGYFAYALDANSGKVVWRGDLNYGSTETEPSASKEYVFFPQRDGTLTAFRKGSEKTSLFERYPKPEKVWEAKLDDSPLLADKFSPAVAAGGHVLITTYKGALFCLNESTGAVEWQKDGLGDQMYWSGAVYENKFILGTSGGIIFWYDINNGNVLYSVNTTMIFGKNSSTSFSTTPIAANNGFYISGTCNGNSTIFCFDYNNTLTWKNNTGGRMTKVGALSEGRLYAVTFNGRLMVFDGVQETKMSAHPATPGEQTLPVLFVMLVAIVAMSYFLLKRIRGSVK